MLSHESTEISAKLSLLRVVRMVDREGNRNNVLPAVGVTFSDMDLCTQPSTALLAYRFGGPPHSDKVDIELLIVAGDGVLRDIGASTSLYTV